MNTPQNRLLLGDKNVPQACRFTSLWDVLTFFKLIHLSN